MFKKYVDHAKMYYTTKERYELIKEYYGLSQDEVRMQHPLLKLFSYGSSFIVIMIAFGLSNYMLALAICIFDLFMAPIVFGYTLALTKKKKN